MSRARRIVESAFGNCASKWRILDKAIETNVDTGVEIVKCISLLHNIIDFGDYCCLHSRWSQTFGIIAVCIPDQPSLTPYRCSPHERPESSGQTGWSLLPARVSVLHLNRDTLRRRTAPFTYMCLSAQASGRETGVHAGRCHAGRSFRLGSATADWLRLLVKIPSGA